MSVFLDEVVRNLGADGRISNLKKLPLTSIFKYFLLWWLLFFGCSNRSNWKFKKWLPPQQRLLNVLQHWRLLYCKESNSQRLIISTYVHWNDVRRSVQRPDASLEELFSQVRDIQLMLGPQHAALVTAKDLDGFESSHLFGIKRRAFISYSHGKLLINICLAT